MTREPNDQRTVGRFTTPVLAILAIVVVAMVWHKGSARQSHSDQNPPARSVEDKPSIASQPTRASVFTDVTAESGLAFRHECGAEGGFRLPELIGSGGAFLDYDNDGDMDIYLVQSGMLGTDDRSFRNRLFRNDGKGRFTDVSEASGADLGGYGMGCSAADYDNDGDIDIHVTRLGPNALLRNNGDGTFTEVTALTGVGDSGFGTGAAFLDYDRDGLLDLYVVNYVDWQPHSGVPCYDAGGVRDYCAPAEYAAASHDVLYHNLGNGRFERVTEKAGMGSVRGNGLGVICTDFDDDGWVDIYVANDQTPGFLWINLRDGTFREDAALRGCAYSGEGIAIGGMGTAAEDFDGDGDYDLLVMNLRDQAHLYMRNDGGFFEDAGHAAGFGSWDVPFTGFGIGLFDQDHDGRLDGFIANGAVTRPGNRWRDGHPYAEPNQFVRRDEKGRFFDASQTVGPALGAPEVSRGVILGDYDNDGDLDVLVTNNCGAVQLLRNDNASGHSWTMLDLVARGGGRNAINARVVLDAGGETYRREVRPHVGYLGSNDPRIHVGLGHAQVIDRLAVTWPDGTTESWEHVPVNKHLRWNQGSRPRAEVATGG